MSVERYWGTRGGMVRVVDGEYIRYSDHLAEIQRIRDAVRALGVFYCEDQWSGAETHLMTSEVLAILEEAT